MHNLHNKNSRVININKWIELFNIALTFINFALVRNILRLCKTRKILIGNIDKLNQINLSNL